MLYALFVVNLVTSALVWFAYFINVAQNPHEITERVLGRRVKERIIIYNKNRIPAWMYVGCNLFYIVMLDLIVCILWS